ncbi:hypothetical protein GCM10007421_15620 [Halopseudomonas oceani]|uniref:Uncharacterized protein n=1 Tax=Halopseudomonas oceani TaxID=1708783 RepID=A0A2P4EZB6_9GAMM|nr:hypothetical protein [Halopseudomonas oceani]POB05796.1 hypothetical protein C1949_03690 [Halopseudomonas oceani]GGE42357.1 hypothetical protein GCM10007421_15620 [Halopseudomonas oceani]
MDTKLEEWKVKLEILEKALVCLTLVLAIGGSGYKTVEFLGAKRIESETRTESIETLTKVYVESLNGVEADIRALDAKLAETVWKGSSDWDKLSAIRDARAKDRADLLEKLGAQIVQLKQAEN